jgi:biotin carboxylase
LRSSSHLNGIAEIRAFFRTCSQPVYYIGPACFHLLGMDRWVPNFQYIAYYDPWDGRNPRVFAPKTRRHTEFGAAWPGLDAEQISNHLLRDPEVHERLRQHGDTPMITMLCADEETEEICREQGYHLIMPPFALRHRLDSKIVTTVLGNEAGIPSVPNVFGKADSYGELAALAAASDLGSDLVVQLPYGSAGSTTFFIADERDWDRCAARVSGEQVKVMKRINTLVLGVEACVTRHGTIVGPVVTQLIGQPELTPYKGGWCGDLFPDALPEAGRNIAISHVRKLGDRIAEEGYKGIFQVDVLADLDSGEVYLGELNPRLSGVSPVTNVMARADSDAPLFLFHLLEFMDVDYTINPEEINKRWRALATEDIWSQLIMKEPGYGYERILAAPRAGSWRLRSDGTLAFHQLTNDWHEIATDDEAFFMPTCGPGDIKIHGADLGVLVTREPVLTADGLTERCQHYIAGIKAQYQCEPASRLLKSARKVHRAAQRIARRVGVPPQLEERATTALWQTAMAWAGKKNTSRNMTAVH